MEALSFDNILGEQDIENLFTGPEETTATEDVVGSGENPEDIENSETNTTTEVDPDSLFEEEEQPESVGSEKQEVKEKGDSSTEDSGGTSLNNFYSSIANAVAEDGVFPNLDEETIKKATDAESFSELFDLEINARLDDVQKRIKNALENGVEPSDIRKYENTLNYLSTITDNQLAEEGEKGEELRRRIIYQDFLNKGYSADKAQKFTERTIDAGTDIEDAKEALQSNREYFTKQYDKLLKDAQNAAEEEKAERQKQADKLKKSILEDKQLMGDMELSSELRKKAFDNIYKPIYRDPETGEYMTALQKYEAEHHEDFIKYVGLFMTLTNGFKDFKSFAKAEAKKEMKKGLRELEQTLNGTRRSADGSLKIVTKVSEDPESYLGRGFKLDL